MHSPSWYVKRKACIDRAGGICEICKKRKAVHAHHLIYNRFGFELPEDLQAVCLPCHEDIHGKPIEKRKTAIPKGTHKQKRQELRTLLREQRKLYNRLKAEHAEHVKSAIAHKEMARMDRELTNRLKDEGYGN